MKLLSKIKKDKLLHLLAGVYIYLICRLFLPKSIIMAIVLIVAILKELLWDGLLKKGTPELMDAAYTIWGGISVWIIDFD